jgi:3',5'-cyclic AMP phosphodiesterase CpdA
MLVWTGLCPAEETLFTFVQFSDVHVGHRNNEPNHPRLAAAVALANSLNPPFVIDSGDMTNNPVYDVEQYAEPEYNKYLNYISPLTMPIYQLPGNHDIGYFDYNEGSTYETDYEALVAAYVEHIGPLNQSFTHQGFRFILFNNNPPLSGEPGHISEETFDWIEDELGQGERAFLFCHVQILENGTGDPWGESAERLADLCEEYGVIAVGYGHKHQQHAVTLDGTHYIMCPDLKSYGHQSVYQYQVFDDHFELLLVDVYSQHSTPVGSFQYIVIPEPSSVVLICLGALALFVGLGGAGLLARRARAAWSGDRG